MEQSFYLWKDLKFVSFLRGFKERKKQNDIIVVL